MSTADRLRLPRLDIHVNVQRLRWLIVAAYVVMALPYCFSTPIFEKPDEDTHFAFARHLASGGELPVQAVGEDEQSAWKQEGSQPPLYYALASLVIRPFDTSDFPAQQQPNASPQYDPYAPSNKNKLIVTPEKRSFAYENTTLAAVVLRMLGLPLGVAIVVMTYHIAHMATRDERIALTAMALAAFNPMLPFITTSVSNDGLAIALTTAALFVLAQCVTSGASFLRVALLGALIALASLTKLNGAVLLPIALAALVWNGRDNVRRTAASLAIMLVLWLAVAGWWFMRNLLLYGEPTGTTLMAQIAGRRDIPLAQALGEFVGFKLSYFALFGQVNVPVDRVWYVLFDLALIASGIGLLLVVIRRMRRVWQGKASSAFANPVLVILLAHIALTLVGIVRWTMMTHASQGRLLFPAIAGVSTFLAIGLHTLMPRVAPLLVAPFAALTLIAPAVYIAPTYAPPLIAALPDNATPVVQTFETDKPVAQVIGFKMDKREVRPGERVRVSAFMRALRATPHDYSLVVRLYGRDNQLLDRFDTFTGGGLLPSRFWQSDDVWRDDVQLTIPKNAAAPALLRVQFELFNAGSGHAAASFDGDGKTVAPLYDGATLLPHRSRTVNAAVAAPLATFGDLAALEAFTYTQPAANQPLRVTLKWRTLAQADRDYTVFVHLVDANGQLHTQHDAPPLGGQFPSTRWQADIRFDDTHTIPLPPNLPPGEYRVLTGLYDAHTGARLPVKNAQGEASPNHSLILATLRLP